VDYEFSDKLGHRGRECRYGITHEGRFYSPTEAASQKLAVFASLGYSKNGKWSFTRWRVSVKSAKLIVCMSPWDGWPDDLEKCLSHVSETCETYIGYTPTREESLIFFQSLYSKVYQKILELHTSKDSLV